MLVEAVKTLEKVLYDIPDPTPKDIKVTGLK